jgi:hypothetical protein
MAVVVVARWKGDLEQATPLVKEVASGLKRHGAVSVHVGPCYSGAHAGQILTAVSYPDWETFGKAQQALATDPQLKQPYSEATKIMEIQERSVIVAEDF